MKEDPKMIIIGAGIAGLAAGCYAQMNGFETEIFELHSLPGGLCTSWSRKGYTFDGCIHWLVGSNPASGLYKTWREVGALEGRTVYDTQEYMRIELEGKTLIVYTNVDQFEQGMIEHSPEDRKTIKEFTDGIRTLSGMDMPVDRQDDPLKGLKTAASLLGAGPTFLKWSKVTVQQYADRLKDPWLRQALPLIAGIDFPMVGLMYMLAWMNNRDAGYPIGGSLEFSKDIERRYLALGGKIHYHARVDKILVENDTAVGIRLCDGSEHRAGLVVSAADGHATIFDMLEGKYINDTIRGYYNEFPIFEPIVQVSLGINRDFSGEPSMVNLPLEKPFTVSGVERKRMGYKVYNFDPTLAPAGKSVVEVMFELQIRLLERDFRRQRALRSRETGRGDAGDRPPGAVLPGPLRADRGGGCSHPPDHAPLYQQLAGLDRRLDDYAQDDEDDVRKGHG